MLELQRLTLVKPSSIQIKIACSEVFGKTSFIEKVDDSIPPCRTPLDRVKYVLTFSIHEYVCLQLTSGTQLISGIQRIGCTQLISNTPLTRGPQLISSIQRIGCTQLIRLLIINTSSNLHTTL